MTRPVDLAAVAERVLAATDPASCGTCRKLAGQGLPTEHTACARRAVLLPAPDAPDYEDLVDLTDEQRTALPPRFHIPVFDGLGVPNGWHCAVCWGDGWTTRWPCETAVKHGGDVFTAEHHAERARADVHALANGVHNLSADLDKAQAATASEKRVNAHLVEKHTATLAAADEWMEERAQLLAENERLRVQLAAEQRAHGETINERDQAAAAADKLAAAIAPPEVRGEHSDSNNPWENALDHAAEQAEAAATCADCGHLKSAHYDAVGDDVSGCNASGAKVRACTCWYFIPTA
jgi:hypothetical protein